MPEQAIKDELLALVQDTREYLKYLRELGVEGVEPTSNDEPSQAIAIPVKATSKAEPAVHYSALKRNAEAAKTIEKPVEKLIEKPIEEPIEKPIRPPIKASSTIESRTPPAAINQSPHEQTDMATRSTKKSEPIEPLRKPASLETPPPQETLFGEITPKDEASLPNPGETLEDIWNDIGECIRCPLSQSRTHIVHSEGNRSARLMFVGEAPGADEDATARPFVGRAGQLLNKIIEAIGMRREDVFIGNVNRCRPPQNRTPTLDEAKTCKPFLLREIAVVQPEVIVVLGNTAMKNLLDTKEGITKVRGKFQDYRGIKVMPTFHPAYLLRDPSKKREAWEDMKKVRDYLDGKLKL